MGGGGHCRKSKQRQSLGSVSGSLISLRCCRWRRDLRLHLWNHNLTRNSAAMTRNSAILLRPFKKTGGGLRSTNVLIYTRLTGAVNHLRLNVKSQNNSVFWTLIRPRRENAARFYCFSSRCCSSSVSGGFKKIPRVLRFVTPVQFFMPILPGLIRCASSPREQSVPLLSRVGVFWVFRVH